MIVHGMKVFCFCSVIGMKLAVRYYPYIRALGDIVNHPRYSNFEVILACFENIAATTKETKLKKIPNIQLAINENAGKTSMCDDLSVYS